MLTEESSPYVVGFLLWLIPTAASIFGMGFLDRYGWLRNSTQVMQGLHIAGVLMIVTGGLWTAFQSHAGRIMAYAAIAETRFTLLALSLNPIAGVQIVFLLLIPHGPGLAVWVLALSIIKTDGVSLSFGAIQGIARKYPLAPAGRVFSALSSAGFPLLAGFPPRLALWGTPAHQAPGSGVCVV